MRAWSLLLACGLRLHRWSDRAVAEVAVAGMRPPRQRWPGGVAETVLAQLKVDSADPGCTGQSGWRGC
jgi:hypothetical protein